MNHDSTARAAVLSSFGYEGGRDISSLLEGAAGQTITVRLADYLTTLRFSSDIQDSELAPGEDLLVAILREKLMDPATPALMASLRREGWLVPIFGCVLPDGEGLWQGNGHHRLVAALLLGLETVEVFLEPNSEGGYTDAFEVSEYGPWEPEVETPTSGCTDLVDWGIGLARAWAMRDMDAVASWSYANLNPLLTQHAA